MPQALLRPGTEVAIIGPAADEYRGELSRQFLCDTVLARTETASQLPLLHFLKADKQRRTAVHVCRDHACRPPVYGLAEALAAL